MEETIDKWDKRFLQEAKLKSEWSKDPRSKVGAVIVRPDNTVASSGVNGLPRSLPDEMEDQILYDRNLKNQLIIHAEQNALNFRKEEVKGYTIYVWPYHPCTQCAANLIQNGIIRVVIPKQEDVPSHWVENFERAKELLLDCGVKLDTIDRESISLYL